MAPPDGAHFRRVDGLAVTQERQELGLNTYESSSQPSTARAPTGSGGARAGRGEGISVGTPRCRRIRPITGARFNSETLEVTLRGKTIDDILNMSVEEGMTFFAAEPILTQGSSSRSI